MNKECIGGKRVLLVEDDFLISMDMTQTLIDLGARDVTTASSLETGLQKAEKEQFDLAVLDMNLRGKVSFGIALKIKERGIPMFFVSGYGTSVELPPELSGTTVLTKPVEAKQLAEAASKLQPSMSAPS